MIDVKDGHELHISFSPFFVGVVDFCIFKDSGTKFTDTQMRKTLILDEYSRNIIYRLYVRLCAQFAHLSIVFSHFFAVFMADSMFGLHFTFDV